MNLANSPVDKIMLKKTAATNLIILIIDQIFLSDNDITEAG
jgi:hypothetical protein